MRPMPNKRSCRNRNRNGHPCTACRRWSCRRSSDWNGGGRWRQRGVRPHRRPHGRCYRLPRMRARSAGTAARQLPTPSPPRGRSGTVAKSPAVGTCASGSVWPISRLGTSCAQVRSFPIRETDIWSGLAHEHGRGPCNFSLFIDREYERFDGRLRGRDLQRVGLVQSGINPEP